VSRSWIEGLDVSAAQFWLTSVGAGAATYLVVLAVTSLPLVSLMPAIVVATLPRAYFSRRHARRLQEIQAAWPDGIRDVISSVRSGASLPSAVESLATYGPAPLRQALQGFPVYARSLGFVAALEMVKADLADPTSDRVIEVLILGYERGGNVVPRILADLADATTRDIWTLEAVRTEALEQKINARVVFVLPWFVLVAITARPGPFREFYSSAAGLAVVVIGAVMSLVGVVVASRLGRQAPEPRVFGEGRPG
jgi:tight adherence protein B